MSYEQRDKERFFERADISKTNKEYVKDFFKGYNCAKTSEAKFYKWLPYVLTQCKDIKATMHNEAELKEIFNKIHSKLKPSGYKTTLTTTKTFCRELNKGIAPETFSRVKQLTKQEKKLLLRAENPNYKTLSWEDGLKICEQTNSLQLKTLVLTELDGGLRPAELEGLNYGDAKKDGKFIFLSINKTKTADPRDVILFKSAPYLNRWLDMHPTKKDNDPLWLIENVSKSSLYNGKDKVLRFNYDAIRQTLRRMAKKAGYKHSTSLYMMRHSAVSLAKQDMVSAEIAAEKFGHDIQYYVNVYGRLSKEQKRIRSKVAYGETDEKEKAKPKPLVCRLCQTINEPEKELCEKCNDPLTLEAAMKHDKSKQLEKQIEMMQAKMDKFEKAIKIIELYEKSTKKP
ncbi:MAG: site-specific integrase [Nanoarchaeota archaeon]|nr:site-specific integrase [Nanoarchaeota archaeon]